MDNRLRKLANKALEAAGAAPILTEEEKLALQRKEIEEQIEEQTMLIYRQLKFGQRHNLEVTFVEAEDRARAMIQKETEEAEAAARKAREEQERQRAAAARAEAERQAKLAAEKAAAEAAEKLRLDRIANIEKRYPTIWD
jgi:hypothetical protein